MKRLLMIAVTLGTGWLSPFALASDAETSATAGSNRLQPNGTAQAAARYEGDRGFARTQSRSGPVNLARGVAVGVDERGLSLSVSQAVAPQAGPALAANFNMSIGMDGRVSGSTGLALSEGPLYRSASAGGRAGTGRVSPAAVSYASGKSDPNGRVTASTRAYESRSRPVSATYRAYPPSPIPVVRIRLAGR